MSDFGDFNSSMEDPTADFLARERVALGDDADLFANDSPSLSSPAPQQVPLPSVTPTEQLENRAFSPSSQNAFSPQAAHGFGSISPAPAGDYSAFESEFPAAEELETSQAFINASTMPDVEPEVVKQWREKQKELIAERDAESEAKKHEIIQKAREAIDQFYEDYNDKKQKAIEQNREKEENEQSERDKAASGTVWDRITREIDPKTNTNTRDVSRMKQLMMDLKKDSRAPGTILAWRFSLVQLLLRTFFVHEDVLAHPLYSIQLGKTPIANSSAQRILEEEQAHSKTDQSSHQELQKSNYDKENHSYMLMKSQSGQSYLCRIPKNNSSVNGDVASEKEEPVISDEDRKERGLQLLAPLYKHCIHAWPRSFWAYEYCHLEHVKQFNSPPNSKGYIYPPGDDPENQNFVHGIQYVLGRFNGDDQIPTSELQKSDNKEVLLRTNVHTIGQRSYLAQRWRYGDKCDITGKPREIEIQFHCSMQHEEHIESVQELATCEYQMVISTPRLCQDVAFAPRASQDVNRIQCDPVIPDEKVEEYERAEAERQKQTQSGTQIIFNKLIENGKSREEQEKLKQDIYDENADEEDVERAVTDVTEELLAALEKELDQLVDEDDKSPGGNGGQGDDTIAKTDDIKNAKKPQFHYLQNIEGLEGFRIEQFLSSENLEQQLQEIVKTALSQAKEDMTEDPKAQPSKPKDQGNQHPRIRENLNAYQQVYADDQDEKDKEDEQPVNAD
ncbi:hypothetical protein NQZ79_g4922 [Umbelopsis isabellina]|nr:hypothetical protein NQZ79_g4922 [Umbelopsis isabellina]